MKGANEMTKEEKAFYACVLELLAELKKVCDNDDYLISLMLQSALSQHLHDCKDFQIADHAFNFLQGSFTQLYQTMMPSTTMEGSSSYH
jgi:hypothetical protein